MKLKQLLAGVNVIKTNVDPNMEIASVVYDSRKVTPGCMFVAITGFATDGNRYIPMALEKGAAVVVTAKPQTEDVPYVLVDNDRLALALIGGNFFDHPGDAMKLIGITGTNGKTSSTLLLKHVLEQVLEAKVGLIGTMDNRIGDEIIPTERTTPESFELQQLLAKMRDAGCSYVIMEVSSHAIALDRVAGLHYHCAAFTNLTEDHLDFHKTMEAYCDTKAELFRRCRMAVANADDEWFARIARNATCPLLTTAVNGGADLRAEDLTLLSDGISFTAVYGKQLVAVKLPIPGKFTVYNALTVLGCALQLGISLDDAASAMSSAKGVKGRVEVVPTPGKDYTVLIDYAHTPDGLENVLSSVKGYCKGRLIAVFGCGGDRDPVKRPIMGKIGVDIADYAIITSDNPRTEDPMKIIQDIVNGVDSSKKNYEILENRPKAIHRAMDIAEKNDIIVLAGKGHETYQEICGVKHHLDEREVVAAYLAGNEERIMGRITLQQAADWCGGRVDPKYSDVTFFGANNDSRKIEKGQLFIALQGARDGHDFIPAALEKGAAAVLCTRCDGDYPAIVVEDTRLALGQIARGERERIGMKVVGVTGSVGKSTTKEMVASVLESTYRVAKTPANHNNDIGMPMAILEMPEDTQVAVLEMGMNHFREIAYLSSIGKPDIAVIINIGTMHIEHLGSMEGILQAKLEILEGMAADSKVVLNGDDALLWNQRNTLGERAVYFGVQNTDSHVLGRGVFQNENALSFAADIRRQELPLVLPLEGEHFVYDALAAVAVGLEMGVDGEKIRQSLLHFQNMEGRQEIYEKNGYTIIQDCYNAGPESMNAALTVLGNRPGRRVAVLGDMLELGVCSDAEHYKVGRLAARKADVLLAYGNRSERMLYGAITGGMSQASARAFTDKALLIQTLKQLAKPGDVLLFKGSRGMRMEQVLEAFLEDET